MRAIFPNPNADYTDRRFVDPTSELLGAGSAFLVACNPSGVDGQLSKQDLRVRDGFAGNVSREGVAKPLGLPCGDTAAI